MLDFIPEDIRKKYGWPILIFAILLLGYVEYDNIMDELKEVRRDLLQEQLDHSETKEELQRFKELYYSQH